MSELKTNRYCALSADKTFDAIGEETVVVLVHETTITWHL